MRSYLTSWLIYALYAEEAMTVSVWMVLFGLLLTLYKGNHRNASSILLRVAAAQTHRQQGCRRRHRIYLSGRWPYVASTNAICSEADVFV